MEQMSESDRYEAGVLLRDYIPPEVIDEIGKLLLDNSDDLC